MAYLSWISDEDFKLAVADLLAIGNDSLIKAEKKFEKNVIDPFSAMFQIVTSDLKFLDWEQSERTRQAQKTLQNHIGNFHQNILGSVEGWENLKTGKVMDLLCEESKILAEVKNKHNTVKGSNLSDLYKTMGAAVMPKSSKYKGYTAYYVTIIPKKPIRFNTFFTPSDKETGSKLPENEQIRLIDGASFYELVTGDTNALRDFFNVLPMVINDVSKKKLDAFSIENLNGFFQKAYG